MNANFWIGAGIITAVCDLTEICMRGLAQIVQLILSKHFLI